MLMMGTDALVLAAAAAGCCLRGTAGAGPAAGCAPVAPGRRRCSAAAL